MNAKDLCLRQCVAINACFGGSGEKIMNRSVVCLIGLTTSLSAFSHHSNSAYRVTEVISLTGTVQEWRWVNPHTWLFLVIEDENGGQQEWALEGRAPGILARAGWNPEVFRPGETVTVHGSPAKDGSAEAIIARVTKADGTILGNSPDYFSGAEGSAAPPVASTDTTPDFSGVYYPYRPNAGGGMGAQTATPSDSPPPPPARSAPIGDGSLGRLPHEPKLTPEYLAQWEVIAESLTAGSYEYDNSHNCLPPGMPSMMAMPYGMEVMQNEQKITFFGEHLDALRRVYLDGREPSGRILNDPTYAGYSTGHWDGDTLVVETVALTINSYITGKTPHSDRMTIHERIRFTEPGILEDRITVHDPVALTEPWEVVYRYRKASYPNDELREFACAEGLRDSPVHQ